MTLNIDDEIRKANQELGRCRIKIIRRGGRLWLRGTLPVKPGSSGTKPYQQKFSAKASATMAGVKQALKLAKLISSQLDLDKFNWEDWIDIKFNTCTVGYWIEKFEDDYWAKRERTLKAERSWNASYRLSFSKLPVDEDLTLELLLEVAKSTKPNSKIRQNVCRHFSNLAKFAELPNASILLDFKGDYSPSSVNPRSLPSDELIFQVISGIKHRQWQWWLAMCATYGLRPSEAFYVNLENFPEIEVKNVKSKQESYRLIYPLYPEWADEFNLREISLPHTTETKNTTYGQRLSMWVKANRLPFLAYDLRHCYALRCFLFGIAPDRAAVLMGHSMAVHLNIYRAWIDKDYYRNYFKETIYRSDRPKPP